MNIKGANHSIEAYQETLNYYAKEAKRNVGYRELSFKLLMQDFYHGHASSNDLRKAAQMLTMEKQRRNEILK